MEQNIVPNNMCLENVSKGVSASNMKKIGFNGHIYNFGVDYDAMTHNINDPYAKFCVPDVVRNMNVKVFNLMSRTNKTRHIEWHETCKYKCRLAASVCNNKQKLNEDKCRCECEELIDKGVGIKDSFGILVIVSVNVINRVILVSI